MPNSDQKTIQIVVELLLALGLVFPVIGYLSFAASLWTYWRHKQHSSAVLIPFVGPLLISAWILIKGYSAWFIPLVFALDIGTVIFLIALPKILSD